MLLKWKASRYYLDAFLQTSFITGHNSPEINKTNLSRKDGIYGLWTTSKFLFKG